VSLRQLALYRRFADSGRLPIRVYAMANGDAEALDALCAMGLYRHPGGRLQMRTVKLYIDGALGSRGAALIEDYSDEPGNRGLLLTEPSAFERTLQKARDCGVQVAAHAIGDRGNRMVLDGFQRALGTDAGTADHRWRIEHAQVVNLADIPRFAQMGVIASMQPTHATSDMRWAQARLGKDRLAGAYAWRRMKDAGVALALGSDFPVEAVDPVLGLHAAATRQDARGWPEGGWLASQKLEVAEALRGFSLDAARAGFAEQEIGSLEVGKRADFVILSQALEGLAPPAVLNLRVQSTWVDGAQMYPAR
jgi:predicted amidohydrolase YtcJ